MPINQITPDEAKRLIDDGYTYLDVRTEGEFAGGHPEKAVNVPVVVPDPARGAMVPNPEFLPVVEALVPKDAKLILGCQSGARSQRAAEILAAAGYRDVSNMRGGFGGLRDQMGRTVQPGWAESGLPVCRGCGEENSYAGVKSRAGR